jgi:hypothetical protein
VERKEPKVDSNESDKEVENIYGRTCQGDKKFLFGIEIAIGEIQRRNTSEGKE